MLDGVRVALIEIFASQVTPSLQNLRARWGPDLSPGRGLTILFDATDECTTTLIEGTTRGWSIYFY